jgi:hypothetical protein
MTETEDESSDAPKSQNSLIADWKPEDFRLLKVTIVATVIANVITVVLVALAILVARFAARPHHLSGAWNWLPIAAAGPVILWMTGYAVQYQKKHRVARRFLGFMNAFFIFAGVLAILAIIGFAVGVK